MNVFLRELRANFKVMLAWAAGILFFQFSGYSKFQGFKEAQSSNSLNTVVNSFPKALAVLFGMYNLNIGTLIGYFGILYLYFVLIAAIYSGLLGASIISKEERDKTSEFLYTKPEPRSEILSAKILAGLVYILIIFAIISISSIVGVGITNNGNYSISGQVMSLMWGLLLVQVIFFSFGIFFASLIKKPKLPATLVSIAIVSAYLFSVVADLSSNFSWLHFFTPLQWFSAPNIINNSHVNYSYAAICLLLSLMLIALSFVAYNKRDITV